MKHLFLARHGDYNNEVYGSPLTENGRQQIQRLAQTLKSIINPKSAHLVSSDRLRACQSAEILAQELGLPKDFPKLEYLLGECRDDLDNFIKLMDSRPEDALLAVGHLELTMDFPKYYAMERQGKDCLASFGIDKGKCLHMDLERQTYRVLP